MKYLIVIERTGTGFSAYSPDLPGCIATGNTRDEVEREMKGAVAFHLDGLKAEGMAPSTEQLVVLPSRFRRSFASIRRCRHSSPRMHVPPDPVCRCARRQIEI